MRIQEFVKTTILEIVNAVKQANDKSPFQVTLVPVQGAQNQTIEFDIAVTVGKEGSGAAETGIKVLNLDIVNAELKGKISSSSVSRVKFGIYVAVSSQLQGKLGRKSS